MNSEKLNIKAKAFLGENSPNIVEIANKKGIILPSTHLAIFKSVYAPIEEANDNGIRLARHAVEKALPGIVGSQVNLEHFGKGFMVGVILDAWLNADDEIEIAFTFAKNIYPDEYLRALGRMQEGNLSVSFELLSARESQDHLSDGTIRLNDVDFQGVGLLIDETPAYKKATTYEVANIRERALHCSENQFICASQIVKACDKVLAQDLDYPIEGYILITTTEEGHFHLAEIDFEGNGRTFDTVGDHTDHEHMIKNFQIQGDKHTHRILAEMLAKLQKHLSKKQGKDIKTKDKSGGKTNMNEEQTKKVAELRAELGDFAKDVKDEDLLVEETVEEIRKAKTEAEKTPEETKEEAKEESTEETKEEATEEKSEAEAEEETEEEAEAEAEETSEEKTETESKEEASEESVEETAEEKIARLENRVNELEAEIQAKDSEIAEVRANAEKIGKLKVELKDNKYVANFKDEDYLNEEKVEKAKLQKENDDLQAKLVKLSQKDKVDASKETEEESLPTGHEEESEEVSASTVLRKRYRTDNK